MTIVRRQVTLRSRVRYLISEHGDVGSVTKADPHMYCTTLQWHVQWTLVQSPAVIGELITINRDYIK